MQHVCALEGNGTCAIDGVCGEASYGASHLRQHCVTTSGTQVRCSGSQEQVHGHPMTAVKSH